MRVFFFEEILSLHDLPVVVGPKSEAHTHVKTYCNEQPVHVIKDIKSESR